jgi:hypothetical protein
MEVEPRDLSYCEFFCGKFSFRGIYILKEDILSKTPCFWKKIPVNQKAKNQSPQLHTTCKGASDFSTFIF